jgi:hypothetical protein
VRVKCVSSMPSKEEVESHSALPTSDLPPRPDQWWTCRAEAEGEGGQHTIGFDLLFDAAGPRYPAHGEKARLESCCCPRLGTGSGSVLRVSHDSLSRVEEPVETKSLRLRSAPLFLSLRGPSYLVLAYVATAAPRAGRRAVF